MRPPRPHVKPPPPPPLFRVNFVITESAVVQVSRAANSSSNVPSIGREEKVTRRGNDVPRCK